MIPTNVVEGRIRIAALLVLLGLVIEGVTLSILHPLSFVTFASLGVLCMAAGIVLFLLTLLQAAEVPPG